MGFDSCAKFLSAHEIISRSDAMNPFYDFSTPNHIFIFFDIDDVRYTYDCNGINPFWYYAGTPLHSEGLSSRDLFVMYRSHEWSNRFDVDYIPEIAYIVNDVFDNVLVSS